MWFVTERLKHWDKKKKKKPRKDCKHAHTHRHANTCSPVTSSFRLLWALFVPANRL